MALDVLKDAALIEAAKDRCDELGDTDLDVMEKPKIIRGEFGAWVAAWVWVPYPEYDDDEDDGEGGE